MRQRGGEGGRRRQRRNRKKEGKWIQEKSKGKQTASIMKVRDEKREE